MTEATGTDRSPAGPGDRSWMVLVGAVAFLAALAGLPGRATVAARVTADEPQYLLTATSLAEDRDLDIADEIAAQAYLDYHEVRIDEQTRPLAGGRRISPHDPLLPALLAVPVAVGGWVGAKVFLAATAGLAAMATWWVAVRRAGVGPAAAAAVVATAFAGIPLAAYGAQVYPEMPAALLVVAAVGAVTSPRIDRHPFPAVATMVAVTALPWLAVKYAPVAAVLGSWLALRLVRRRRWCVAVVAAGALGVVVHLVGHRLLYGGWTAYATGDHFVDTGELSVVGTDPDPAGRARRLAGLLVDRSFGIAAWSPVWFLLPVAVGAWLRRGGTVLFPAVVVVATGWFTATFVALTMHGWWMPGRQLVVVLPVGVVLLAAWADGSARRLRAAVVLGAMGVVNWLWLAAEAALDRRTLVVDFADSWAPARRAIAWALPDGLRAGAVDDVVLIGWTVALVAGVALGFRRGPGRSAGGHEDAGAGEAAHAHRGAVDLHRGGAVG